MEATTVVTICSAKHLDVWRLTAEFLPSFVSAEDYIVYVPEVELDLFRALPGSSFTYRAQEVLGGRYREKLSESLRRSGNASRLGWYLQQFYKLEALSLCESSQLVIWDADCVPLRPIPTFGPDGRPVYMRAAEFHQPYFEAIERFLGLRRIQAQSFVIPGFPIPKQWLDEFLNDVASFRGHDHWAEALIQGVDFRLGAGFSETETLGTWVANKRQSQWSSTELLWERYGTSRFGPAGSFNPASLTALALRHNLDIVSFENWDRRKPAHVRAFKIFQKWFRSSVHARGLGRGSEKREPPMTRVAARKILFDV